MQDLLKKSASELERKTNPVATPVDKILKLAAKRNAKKESERQRQAEAQRQRQSAAEGEQERRLAEIIAESERRRQAAVEEERRRQIKEAMEESECEERRRLEAKAMEVASNPAVNTTPVPVEAVEVGIEQAFSNVSNLSGAAALTIFQPSSPKKRNAAEANKPSRPEKNVLKGGIETPSISFFHSAKEGESYETPQKWPKYSYDLDIGETWEAMNMENMLNEVAAEGDDDRKPSAKDVAAGVESLLQEEAVVFAKKQPYPGNGSRTRRGTDRCSSCSKCGISCTYCFTIGGISCAYISFNTCFFTVGGISSSEFSNACRYISVVGGIGSRLSSFRPKKKDPQEDGYIIQVL